MNYNKNETTKKQKKLVARASKNKHKVSTSIFKGVLVVFLGVCAIGAGAGFGMFKGILDNAPDIDDIDVTPKGFQTTIYNQDNEVVTTLSTINSNRVYAYYDDIPEDLRNSIIAIEDERFWDHGGIDMKGILRAFILGVKQHDFSQGASTITQQLIKNQVFNVGLNEDTFMDKLERKIQEQYLSIELEKRMEKEDILEYYLNTIYLGQGVHGVESAAKKYFDKDLADLTISECAVLAGITQNPYKYDPTAFPEKNAKRRNSVLNKMKELGYITKDEYDTAMADDVYSRIASVHTTEVENTVCNSYFIDAVINELAEQLMDEKDLTSTQAYNLIYSGGLNVYITQDQAIQDICDGVINDDANYPSGTSVALSYQLTITDQDGENEQNFSSENLLSYYKELTGNSKYNLIYKDEDSARAAADAYKEAMLEKTGGKFLAESYATTIQPQASFVIMDQSNGQVKAIVGGRGEKTGNLTLDRATDSSRQPGSTFKILASFAPAVDIGQSLATTYEDAPFNYENGRPVKNWYGSYRGTSTIRTAIQNSMNIVAVKCLTEITPRAGFDYLEKLGFTTLVEEDVMADGSIVSDVNQSLALGGLTNGVTNMEITAAYASLANGGAYNKPVLYTKVLDHDGNVLIDNSPEPKQVFKETTAWLINSAMQDVVTKGTGTPAKLKSGMPVAGKTGTTSSNYDFWFCGSTPYYTASIWMGYDVNTSFSGGSYHKLMWSKIMNSIVELENQDVTKTWKMPSSIKQATVCSKSGLLPSEGCTPITEYFDGDNIPTKHCSSHNTGIQLCADTHMLATEFCPNKITCEYITNDDGTITLTGVDFVPPAGFSTTYCNMHTADTTATATEATATTFTMSMSVNGVGGTISGPSTVAQGGSATFTITPNAGYAISNVTVDGISYGATSSHTINSVNANHTIIATFVPITPATESTTAAPPPTEATTSAATAAP